MKTLKVFVLPLFLVAFTSIQAFANTPPNSPTSKSSELREEIIELVDDIDLSKMDVDTEEVTVEFVINVNMEIVVLNIEDTQISNQVMDLIDRKSIETKGVAVNRVFVLPMVFNKK